MPARVRATRTAAVAAGVALLLSLAAGCSSAPSPSPSASASPSPTPSPTTSSATPSSTTPVPSASPTSASPAPVPTASGFTTGAVSGGTAYAAPAQAHLRQVRVGTHRGYDRVVLDFGTDRVPPFTVTPQASPSFRTDPADLLVTLRGTAGVRVVVHDTVKNATVVDALLPLYPAVRQVQAIGYFEAVVSYGVGVIGPARVRVMTLTDPYRLVVDVAWPTG